MNRTEREVARWLSHDADVRLDVRAGSRERVFALAAEALSAFLRGGRASPAPDRRAIRLEAQDFEALLVAWLNEVAYLAGSGVFFTVRVPSVVLSATSIEAELAGAGPGPSFPALTREVKAATYHGLDLTERNGTFRATILFDV
jgi:SHS2 domain-containing protein